MREEVGFDLEMPRISAFYGIVITMYWRDHAPAHFHASYSGHVAAIEIERLELVEGWLPPRAARFVTEWAVIHRDELRENWERARAHEPLAPIDPPSLASEPMVAVTHAEPIDDHTLRLRFDDGVEREVDLSGVMFGPMGEPLKDPEFFRRVRVDVELRTVVWPNGFDLDPEVLHGDFDPAPPPSGTRTQNDS